MIPVLRLQDVRLKWLELQVGGGYVLHGFLLYYTTDCALWSYLHHAGMIELDNLTGRHSAVFVIDEPPADFVKYVNRRPDHPWLRFFATAEPPQATGTDATPATSTASGKDGFSGNIFQNLSNVTIAYGDRAVAASALFEGSALDYEGLSEVLDLFNLSAEALPCLIWFESLESTNHKVVTLPSFQTSEDAKVFFRRYFSSSEFKSLLEAARGQHARA